MLKRNKRKICIGVLAHVDAGKTTLTEKLLFGSGAIKTPGNVDKGTSVTDNLQVEIERKISVKASTVCFDFNDIQINLIDTPGHSDFSSEINRTLNILDGAILLIPAVEGIEAQTYFLWNVLKEAEIPTIFFINKLDRIGADIQETISEIKSQLTENSLLLESLSHTASENVKIDSFCFQSNCGDYSYQMQKMTEQLANFNDSILEQYLNDEKVDPNILKSEFKQLAATGKLFPIMAGSAKYNIGIKELLEAISIFIQPKKLTDNILTSAQVFKINYQSKNVKEVFLKVLSGTIKVRDSLKNSRTGIIEKVNNIKIPSIKTLDNVSQISTGDIAIMQGLNSVKIGDILGESEIKMKITPKQSSMTVQIKPIDNQKYLELAEALTILFTEEPNLNFVWLKEDKEFHIDVNGNIHMEVISQILFNRFQLKIAYIDPTIIYKETPSNSGIGYVEYTMPKPCWAICKFRIEPSEIGSGVIYKSEVRVDKIKSKYQHEIEKTIPKALAQGILGWEVTDIKITLIDGEDHEIHSRPSDFVIATPMGIMNGLQNSGTTLLEPVLEFTLTVPENKCGRAMSDITRLRGTFSPAFFNNNFAKIRGIIPASTSLNYQIEVSSYTSGKGKFSTYFHSYQPCTLDEGKTRSFRGISPLDRAKYILKARKAITDGFNN